VVTLKGDDRVTHEEERRGGGGKCIGGGGITDVADESMKVGETATEGADNEHSVDVCESVGVVEGE
jgi:hypothetical protein